MKIRVRIIRRLGQEDASDYNELRGRRHRSRLATRYRLHHLAIGVLILSVGLFAASLFIDIELFETARKGDAGAQEPQATSKDGTQLRRDTLLLTLEANESPRTVTRITSKTQDAEKTALAEAAETSEPELESPAHGSRHGLARLNSPDTKRSVSPDTTIVADEVHIRSITKSKAEQQAAQISKPGSPSSDTAQLESAKHTPRAASSPNVAGAQFTTNVVDREPVDRVESVFPMNREPLRILYYFTEIVGMSGESVTHRWIHEGTMMAAVSFEIGSDYWRVWSSKYLTRSMEGDWRVVVTNSEGRVLKEDAFVYVGP